MANWWDAAPVAPQTATPQPQAQPSGGNWWDAAPIAPQSSAAGVPANPADLPKYVSGQMDQILAGNAPATAPEMVRVPIVAGRAGVQGYRMVPKAQLEAGTTGALLDAGRVAANGATLGGFDNAVAGAQALAGDGSYQDNLSAQHALTNQAMQRPGSGFLYGASATAPGMLGAGAASMAARGMGGSIAANLFANAGAGGALGGIAGFNDADGSVEDRAQKALPSAAFGAGLGAAVPPVAEALSSLASAGARRVANALYGARYGQTLPANVADPILSGIDMQGSTVPQIQQTMQNLGPGAALADTGEGLQGMANRIANRDLAARPAMAQNLNGRIDGLDQRVGQAVDQNFGQDVNAVTQMQNLRNTTAANGNRLYGQAFANPAAVDVTPVLQQIDQQIAPGLTQIAGSGVRDDPITAALRQARSYIAGDGSQAANIQTLHRAQDVIDDMAASALRSGNNAQARALWNVRGNLLNQMDSVNPEYAAARQQYASDKSIENAFQNGRDILATRQDGQVFDPDVLESRLAQMTQPEQQAYQLGARKALTDVMGQARSDPAGLRTKLANDNGYAVGKLRQVFGDQPVNNMLGELDAQATMRGTNNTVLGNSATAFRQGADNIIPGFGQESGASAPGGHGSLPLAIMGGKEVGEQIGGLIGHPELGGAVGAAAGPVFKWAGNRLGASRAAASAGEEAATRAAMGDALTSPRQQLVDALMARDQLRALPTNASDGARAVARALLMQQAAEGRNSAVFNSARGLLPAPLIGQ